MGCNVSTNVNCPQEQLSGQTSKPGNAPDAGQLTLLTSKRNSGKKVNDDTKDRRTLAASGDSAPAKSRWLSVSTFDHAYASGLMDGVPSKDRYKGGLALFIIDPQVDFHEGGSLAVPGATKDSQNIISFIKSYSNQIERIVVTLDTHHAMHIHTGAFWEDIHGRQPEAFTTISAEDVRTGKWKARQPRMQAWSETYARRLEAGGRFEIMIWPPHCVLGTPGHAVHAPLMAILNEWAISRKRSINWLFKGQNNRTEMYSALKAEVEVPGDRTTGINLDLVARLACHQQVVCCGEAMSHCVNYSVRDLVAKWPKSRVGDIVLLNNAASPVPGFESAAEDFMEEMRISGVTVCTVEAFKPNLEKNQNGYLATMSLISSFPRVGAAGLMCGEHRADLDDDDALRHGIALFLIDPQQDFHEGGSLAVPGATKDSERIASFVRTNVADIDRIVVTLDTHHAMHIHSGAFWEDADGQQPEPFTAISAEDVQAGKWKARQVEMQAWTLTYARQLEAGGRFQIMIWPPHCLLGTPGHAVHAPLMAALNEWAISRKRSITWLYKGQNNRTEMYSALKAEVEIEDDPTTSFNTSLVALLAKHKRVVCCGQAMSHCVNQSVRDLLSGWPQGRANDIIILEDGASAVPGFTDVAQKFLSDMKKNGVTVCKAREVVTLGKSSVQHLKL